MMTARASLLALVLLASACTANDAPPAAADADTAARDVAIADSSAAAYQTATASGDGSASCAEATAASYQKAGREAEALLWQNMAETACAALQPQIDATLARISDSLAAAKP